MALDRDMPANIRMDILDWSYVSLPPNFFDIVWASAPCTEYSVAKTACIRKLHDANAVVKRTPEITQYFDPPFMTTERPHKCLLNRQGSMLDLPYNDLDYCKYGMR